MTSRPLRGLFNLLPQRLQTVARNIRRSLPLSAKERWVRNEYTPFATEERKRVFMSIARFMHINRPIKGYYMEFGSHEANTMRMAWDAFHHLFDWTFVAFDSFEGLPEIREIDEQEIWKQGKLKTTEREFIDICLKHGMERNRLMTVKGFYDKSLNDETRRRLEPGRAAVAYIDCDLYHSTVPVLEFLKNFLQKGTIIVFDDWNCFLADPEKGERRAWREFRERYPELEFEEFVATGMQKAFVFVGSTQGQGQ